MGVFEPEPGSQVSRIRPPNGDNRAVLEVVFVLEPGDESGEISQSLFR